MKLIDRYVVEVGRRLPLLRGRKDIEKELHSTLEDMLEDRAQKAGHPADEAMEMDLLREYGAPNKVAATYNPTPYLIGPRMFPFYTMVLKIALGVQVIVLLVLLGIQIATQTAVTTGQFLSALGSGLSGLLSATISAFGMITLVFAVLERYFPAAQAQIDDEMEWDPASLLKEPEADDVKIWEPIVEIVFISIALSIFNFNSQWVGFYYLSDGQWTVLPVLSEAFFRWMPWINISWVAQIILDGMLLRSGRWDTSTRLVDIAIKILQMVIGFFLLTGPSILAITPESLQATGVFGAEAARTLGTLAQQGIRSGIALVIFLIGIDVVKSVYQLIRQKTLALA